jgi:hypothetical protein
MPCGPTARRRALPRLRAESLKGELPYVKLVPERTDLDRNALFDSSTVQLCQGQIGLCGDPGSQYQLLRTRQLRSAVATDPKGVSLSHRRQHRVVLVVVLVHPILSLQETILGLIHLLPQIAEPIIRLEVRRIRLKRAYHMRIQLFGYL